VKIPQAFRLNSKQVAGLKSYLRALVSLAVGYAIHKLGADPATSVFLSAATAPILKYLDPTEKSLGIGSNAITSPSS